MSLLRRPDALVDTLDPLVRDGTLTPSQADRVYQSLRASRWSRTPAAATETGWEQPRLWAAVSVLAAGSLGACYLLAADVDEAEGFGWKTLLILLGVSTVLGLAAAAFAVVAPRTTVGPVGRGSPRGIGAGGFRHRAARAVGPGHGWCMSRVCSCWRAAQPATGS